MDHMMDQKTRIHPPKKIGASMIKKDELALAKLWNDAYAAGLKAGNECNPKPMGIGLAKGLFSNEIVPGTLSIVPEGVCGFAWVKIKGTTPFARWAKKTGIAHPHCYGGYEIWCRDFGQSMQRKEAWAGAVAKVLTENGIEAFADSRMD